MSLPPEMDDEFHETDPSHINTDNWTTESKKKMLFGFAVILAGIGVGNERLLEGGWLPILIILAGLYLVFLGYL